MIQEGLFTVLTNDAGVSALVSSRVYPLGIPQNAVLPCIAYTVEEQEENSDYDGQGDFGEIEIQIDCWAGSEPTEYAVSLAVAKAVKAALKNYNGLMGSVRVYRLVLVTSVSVFESKVDMHRTTQVYSLVR